MHDGGLGLREVGQNFHSGGAGGVGGPVGGSVSSRVKAVDAFDRQLGTLEPSCTGGDTPLVGGGVV